MRVSSGWSVARAAPTGFCGRSMPVTSSATDRKGVDDGHAPAQIPHPAHRSARTLAWNGCGRPSVRATISTALYGQSTKQRRQPLQFASWTTAAARRGSRAARDR